MKNCWQYDDKKRPNFEEILDQVEGMFKTTAGDDYYYYDRNAVYDNRTWTQRWNGAVRHTGTVYCDMTFVKWFNGMSCKICTVHLLLLKICF